MRLHVGRSRLYYCRQRPTLPYSFPYSTIGGIRLNFRVRNGNGCDPDPMTTGKLSCLGSRLRSLRGLRRASSFEPAHRGAERREGGSSQTISKSERSPDRLALRTQLNTLQTVVLPDSLTTQRFCVHDFLAGASLRQKTIYGQASRLISIGKLNTSLCLHTRPIAWSSSRSL